MIEIEECGFFFLAAWIWLGNVSGKGLNLATLWVRVGIVGRGRERLNWDQCGTEENLGLLLVRVGTHRMKRAWGISKLAGLFPGALSFLSLFPCGMGRDDKITCAMRVSARGWVGAQKHPELVQFCLVCCLGGGSNTWSPRRENWLFALLLFALWNYPACH